MFTILKLRPAVADGVTIIAAPEKLGGGNAFGYEEFVKAQEEALRMARAYPGNRYEVFELVLVGGAETPSAMWTDANGKAAPAATT